MQVTMVVEKEELRIFQGVSDCFPIFFVTFIFNISIFFLQYWHCTDDDSQHENYKF